VPAALESSIRYLAYELGELDIRVNGISAGPIKTLASSGIDHFRTILGKVEKTAPLKTNISTDDVGNMAFFLSSNLSNKITGQILYVDSGSSILAMM
jgi:enoyl-[acyl-carrier protein] reductase I